MSTFQELGISPELTEALAAEGIEVPTGFQASAIPVLLRGNHLLAQAGPGAGTLAAYGSVLLQRVEPEARALRGLVLTATPEAARRLARSLSRLAAVPGHRVAALGSPWALPPLASILFSTPSHLMGAVRQSALSLEEVEITVMDGFAALSSRDRDLLETLFEILPEEGQRVLFSQPLTPEAEAFGTSHLHRAVHLPPRAAQGKAEEAAPRRGTVRYRVTGEEKLEETLETVAGALEQEETRHVLVFSHTEDQAADLGDFLTLHGYPAGHPGEEAFPVWLGVEEMQARRVLNELDDPASVKVLSHDVPSDPDSLDRRHGRGEEGIILIRSRELPHLKDVARRTGYRLLPASEPVPPRVAGELERLRDRLRTTLEEENLAPHYLTLEPLYEEWSAGEVAAAALVLLHRTLQAGKEEGAPGAPASRGREEPTAGAKPWVRLFVGVGEKDGIGPGDLLGAIAGEAGVEGSQVGKIEIRETFSLVEVAPEHAEQIMKALNGTSIRGRSVRVDYDRGSPRGRRGGGGRTSREDRKRRPR